MATGDLVLGLLIEQPANGYQVDQRLEERFGVAQYARGTGRQALKRLRKAGHVRPVAGQAPVADEEADGAEYEATEAGVTRFEAWMRMSLELPLLREDLLAKLALCGPSDLHWMIPLIHEAELACTSRLGGLNLRLRKEREALDRNDPGERLRVILRGGEVAWWDSRIKWLQKMRTGLEAELEAHRECRVSSRPAGSR
jgi:DNA-binding PadR family transcriptional regulator